MHYTTLISVADLQVHLDRPDWVVCDCRHDLMSYEAGRHDYAQSHIPGARFLHLDEDLSGPKTGTNGRHPLPHPITFTLRLGALGIDNGKQVVAYDSSGGTYAARLWWMLRWVGHARVAVLDGGWDAWVESGRPVTRELPAFAPTTFNPSLQPQLAVSSAYVAEHLQNPQVQLLDARAPDRYRGENETLDPIAGHIPGAANRFYRLNLNGNGRFRPAAELEREFIMLLGGRPAESVVHQCGSGVSACHNLLAMEYAGLCGSRLYPGSWSEWVSDGARPVVQ